MVLFHTNQIGEPGLIWWEVLIVAACFEALYLGLGVLFRHVATKKGVALDAKRKKAFARDGNSYAVSLLHATVVALRSLKHLYDLRDAPLWPKFNQLQYGSPTPWAQGAAGVEPTNTIFLAFLLYDLVHVLREYPRLGSVDTIAHHLGFMVCATVCGYNRVFPWPFSWMAVGEVSTLPLNLRWFLINSGRGDTVLMKMTNTVFAFTFFVGRVVLFGLGLLHMWINREPWVLGPCRRVAGLHFVVGLFVAGYLLNLMWFRKILQMGRRPPRKARSE
jgi:hypothetical protein